VSALSLSHLSIDLVPLPQSLPRSERRTNGSETSATAFSLQVGGGFNIGRGRALRLRATEIDYVRTGLPNGATDSQHDLRIAVGVTYRLHRGRLSNFIPVFTRIEN